MCLGLFMKNKFLFSFAIFTLSIIASTAQAVKPIAPWFELYNKSDVEIRVGVSAFGTKGITHLLGGGMVHVEAGKRYENDIPIPSDAKTIFVNIMWLPDRTGDAEDVVCNEQDFMISNFSSDATFYFSFDTKKNPKLYPQTGPLWGLLGKTSSGYSLDKNIKVKNISAQTLKTSDPSECGLPYRWDD